MLVPNNLANLFLSKFNVWFGSSETWPPTVKLETNVFKLVLLTVPASSDLTAKPLASNHLFNVKPWEDVLPEPVESSTKPADSNNCLN